MFVESISNTDMHLNYDAGRIIKTKEVVDLNGGMNPIYYIKKDRYVEASSSAYRLIKENGGLKRNYDFDPPNWCSEAKEISFLRYPMKLLRKDRTKYKKNQKKWYPCWQTIDERVFKVRPHERVTLEGNEVRFRPTNEISCKNRIAEEAANRIVNFVDRIEKNFPKAEHVVLTGGKDSQIIHTVPKNDKNRWHYLTSEPNYEEIKKWVKNNNIDVNKSYKVDCVNRESASLLRKKVIASDLYSSIRHIRWIDDLKRISSNRSKKTIYWVGTEGDTFFSYNREYKKGSREEFWRMQNIRAPSWQGNFHQTVFNTTNSPVVSPYHSKEMWNFLPRFDPKSIKKGDDIRDKIARNINENVFIKSLNESPSPYTYESGLNTKCIYLDEIKINDETKIK